MPGYPVISKRRTGHGNALVARCLLAIHSRRVARGGWPAHFLAWLIRNTSNEARTAPLARWIAAPSGGMEAAAGRADADRIECGLGMGIPVAPFPLARHRHR